MKHFAKHLALMALAACIGLTGTAANAAKAAPPTSINFGNTPTSTGNFTDLFEFTLKSNGNAFSGEAFSFLTSAFSGSTLTFSKFSILNESNPQSTIANGTGTVSSGGLLASLGPVFLSKNTLYGLQIQGNNLLPGGSYFGTLYLNGVGKIHKFTLVSSGPSVPEPSTWAMMLGGLGLIGFMSYRRRQYL
jgi:hypothetical protein